MVERALSVAPTPSSLDDPKVKSTLERLHRAASGDTFRLGAGDVVAFRGDQRHSYANEGAKPAVGYSVVVIARG